VTLNLTAELERLVADLVASLPVYRSIDPARLLICVSSTRSGGIGGTYAKIHPLRFAGGSRTTIIRRGRRRVTVELPAITHRGHDILYLIYFLVPRFLDLPLREKLITVCHELYHISPAFDGDLRRFPGRNYAHGSSRKKYNELIAGFVDEYLGLKGESHLPRFLSATTAELRREHRILVARRMPAPRLKVVTP
jgi:predicted metallopeptidase